MKQKIFFLLQRLKNETFLGPLANAFKHRFPGLWMRFKVIMLRQSSIASRSRSARNTADGYGLFVQDFANRAGALAELYRKQGKNL